MPRHTLETAAELSHAHGAETGKHSIPSALHSAWAELDSLDFHGAPPKSLLNMILKEISVCKISTHSNYLQASIQNPSVKCFIFYGGKLKMEEMVMWSLSPNHQDLRTLKLSTILFSKNSMTLILRYLEIIATLCMKMFSS